jgi:hypothetical protein
MKQLIIAVLITFTYSCKAQVAPLYKIDLDMPEGTKFKDLDNDLSKFVGTWRWQSNDSTLTIKLLLNEDVYHNETNQYEDYLVGEYKFEVNGQVIQDYIPNLSSPLSQNFDNFSYNVYGNRIYGNNENSIYCNGCGPDERIIRIYFDDPLYDYIPGAMYMRHRTVNGTEIIESVYTLTYSYIEPYENAPDQNRLPFGDYVFIKQ